MRKNILVLVIFVFLVQVSVFGGGTSSKDEGGTFSGKESDAKGNYSIGTGGQSGIYYPFGGAIAKLWSENIDGFHVKAEVTSASVENTIKVASNTLIAGFAQGNVVEQAYQGKGKFEEKQPILSLMSLYPNLLHILLPANTNIKSLADLKGAKISLGAPASGTAVTSENILKSNGIDIKQDIDAVYLNYSETTNALANKQIDAGCIVGGLGVGAVTELALTKDIIILSLSEKEVNNFIAAQPSYKAIRVESDVYNNIPAFNTVAIWNVLVVHENMADDVAYKLAKVIYENNDYLKQVVKSAEYTIPENAKAVNTVPLHPGTQRYLNELQK